MPPKVVKFPEFPFIVRFYDFLRDEVFRVASLFVFGCNAMRCGSSTSKVGKKQGLFLHGAQIQSRRISVETLLKGICAGYR